MRPFMFAVVWVRAGRGRGREQQRGVGEEGYDSKGAEGVDSKWAASQGHLFYSLFFLFSVFFL